MNTAIVGAGLMGRWHAAFASRAGARVAAVIDGDVLRASGAAARHRGARAFASLDEALQRCAIDVVHICTPTGTHHGLASAALDAGAHVLIEKPMAVDANETAALFARAAAAKRLVAPVHQLPYQGGFRRLLRDRAALGDATRVTFLCCTAGAGEGRAARLAALLEVLPHPLSVFVSMFGARALDGLRLKIAGDGDAELAGMHGDVRMTAGVSLDARPTRLGLAYYATKGTAHIDFFHGTYVRERGTVSRRAKITRPFTHAARTMGVSAWNLARRAAQSESAYPGLLPLIEHFYGAASAGGTVPSGEADCVAIARAIDRCRAEMTAAA
jgi:predicted dehydrogenase